MARAGEPESNYGWSGKLILTEEQKKIARKNMCAAKFAYNWMRNQHEKYLVALERIIAAKEKQLAATGKTRKEYEKELHDYEKEQFIKFFKKLFSPRLLRKRLTIYKNTVDDENTQLLRDKQVGCSSYTDAIAIDYKRAIDNIIPFLPLNAASAWDKAKKRAKRNKTEVEPPKFPRDFGFPTYKRRVDSFYVNRFHVRKHVDFERNRVFLSGFGWVKIYSHRKFPQFDYPSELSANARIVFDGIDYYLTISFYKEHEFIKAPQTDILGVSVGMDTLIGTSNGNIWFESEILGKRAYWLDRRIKRLQDHRQRLFNGKSSKFVGLTGKEKYRTSSRLTRYLGYLIRKSQIELNDYKKYQKELLVNNILSVNPKMLVVQKLNVKKLQKNKRYSPKLQMLGVYDLQSTLIRKAHNYNIPVREYRSNESLVSTCSNCGEMGTFKNGTFVCSFCGHTTPVVVNIAQNLKENWQSAEILEPKKAKKNKDILNISS